MNAVKLRVPLLASLLGLFLLCCRQGQADPLPAAPNLLANPGFEAGLAGWEPLWTREPNTGTANADTAVVHGGKAALRVQVSGTKDWSVAQSRRVAVEAGDLFTLSGWVKEDGAGTAQLSVVTRGRDGAEINWMAGLVEAQKVGGWQKLSRVWAVPAGVATIEFRLTGDGPGTFRLDDAALVKNGSVRAFADKLHGKTLRLENAALSIRLNAEDGTLAVTDKRGKAEWRQQPLGDGFVVKDARQSSPRSLRLTVWDVADDLTLSADIAIGPLRPEITVRLTGTGTLTQTLVFPPPFVSGPGTDLILPMNEGILFPVDDASIPPITLSTYSGHGLCMPWFGVVDPATGAGVQTIIQTPDDAEAQFTRRPGSALYGQPGWQASRGAFSYPRALTYLFSASGGYVAQAKQYRAYAQAAGLFKTLAQKRTLNPNIALLAGAVDVWNWDMDKVALCREMKALGMDRVLWSSGGSPAEVAQINALGYLTSRYDIYQDVWPADAPAHLSHAGWPDDLVRLPGGSMMLGWADKETGPDGKERVYQGGVVNSERGLARARQVIPADLAVTPYRCRFLDTTTASPWREDYSPAHPLTRTEDRHYKMALLAFCALSSRQVVGTETGIDPSVPYADYYEGMLSLAPYRLPDSGYEMMAYKTPTPDFLKFQMGHFYRIPLWELVYHECVVAHWYWGDATNKEPEWWPRRDLFNLLYATPPLFLFDRAGWQANKAHFARTYRTVCPLVRRLSDSEMLSHKFLTADHAVQETRWTGGTIVTVNFGTVPYRRPSGTELPAGGWQVH